MITPTEPGWYKARVKRTPPTKPLAWECVWFQGDGTVIKNGLLCESDHFDFHSRIPMPDEKGGEE